MKQSVNVFVDVIKDLIAAEIDKTDTTVLCQVAAKVDNLHYDLFILPDINNTLKNVENMSRFDLEVGDLCYVYTIKHNFQDAFICRPLITADNIARYEAQENNKNGLEKISINDVGDNIIYFVPKKY